MPHPPDVTIRPYATGDEGAILEAFNRTFAAVDSGFTPRDLATWRWQFADGPSRARIWLAHDEAGAVLAQYAAVRQRARLDGDQVTFGHVVDSFVVPEARGGLGRRGLFARTALACIEAHAGDAEDRDVFWWGLPVRAAWRIGREVFGYRPLDPVWTLLLPERIERSGAGVDVVEHDGTDPLPDALDALFERCAGEHGAIAVRDRAQLEWRYRAGHATDYTLAFAVRRSALHGLCVTGPAPRAEGRGRWIVDWLVPRDDDRAAAALLAWARASTSDELRTTLPAASPEWRSFVNSGARVEHTQRVAAARSWRRRRDLGWFARHFFHTPGDTDLV